MVKFTSYNSKDSKHVLGLGLSEANIQKLKEGMPILIDDKQFYDGQIIIMYGRTEEEMAEELGDLITKDTEIRDDKSKHIT